MPDAVLGVMEIGGLGLLVKPDRRPVRNGQLHGLHVADGPGLGGAPHIGQRPVVAVIGNSQDDLLFGNLRQGVLRHPAHHVKGRNGHGRPVGIRAYRLMVIILQYSDLGKTKNGLLIFLGAATAPLTAKQTVMIDLRDTIKTTYGISYIAATFVSLRTNLPGIIQNSSDCGIFYFYNGTDITYNQVVFDYIAIGN